MKKIALFYAPKGGAVDCAARMIADKLGKENVDVMCILEVDADIISKYDRVIFGNSAIHSGSTLAESDRNWKFFLTQLKDADLTNKKVAIFGLGNSLTYPNHFVDSIGSLADFLLKKNANLCGKVSDKGYKYEKSRALRDGMFLGLPLDEDNESEKSEGRIECWVSQLQKEFK